MLQITLKKRVYRHTHAPFNLMRISTIYVVVLRAYVCMSLYAMVNVERLFPSFFICFPSSFLSFLCRFFLSFVRLHTSSKNQKEKQQEEEEGGGGEEEEEKEEEEEVFM